MKKITLEGWIGEIKAFEYLLNAKHEVVIGRGDCEEEEAKRDEKIAMDLKN